jgi:FkbM family methyltransferase
MHNPNMPFSCHNRLRKFYRKPFASLLKRLHILLHGGYSVGVAYGARFLFDWRHSLDKKVALELYEHEQIAYLGGMLDRLKADLFVDIGSHAALYSIIMKTRRPELEVHAFEPDRTNLCQLYANLFVNKLQNEIRVYEHGLSSEEGTVAFDASNETSSRGTRRISETGKTQIQVRRLDDVLQPVRRTVVVKIDVEGHECQVIDGARTLLESNRCFLQIESSGENLSLLTQKLAGLGYSHVRTLCGHDHFFTNIEAVKGPA